MRTSFRLEESHGLDKNIRHLRTFLESYDISALHTIVRPVDSKLRICTLKTRDGVAITDDLLTNYRTISLKTVAHSTAWYNKYGFYMDAQNKRQTLGRDMSWSLLHFKQHVQPSLHTDVEFALHQYPPIQQGELLYFVILMGQLVLSNEQSCAALVSLVQTYNIATDGKDNLLRVIKLLRSATKSIILMRSDKSNRRQHLPDLYVKHILKVLQTSSVPNFTHRIKQYDDLLEFQRFKDGDRSNSSTVLSDVFTFSLGIHTEMRALGTLQDALIAKPKSSFTTIYWKD